jgi:hypothetical protein
MAIESDYRELFSETVTLYPYASVDKYGKRSFTASASVTACAHLVSEVSLARDQDGREVVEMGRVYLYGTFPVTTDYKIQLADGSSPVIIGVDQPHDENGAHHTVVRIGR